VAEICQNRIADKGRIFRGPSVAQIEKCKTNESLDINWGICTRNRRSKIYSENFHKFLRCSTEICFRTATSPNLTSLKLEVLLGTTTKQKRIRSDYYSSNNFQESNKIKSFENKIMGYLPRVLFFNAFELGAVISENAHIGARKELKARCTKELEARESIKTKIWNTFKSKPLPMHRNLVRK
jgi:hypothetical protein